MPTPTAPPLCVWQILKPFVYYFFNTTLKSSFKSEFNKRNVIPELWDFSVITEKCEIVFWKNALLDYTPCDIGI